MNKRVAIIGGGLAGLTAAYRLHESSTDFDIVLYESSQSMGGKIRTSPFMGRPIDEAPDAFLTRVPWAIDLCEELGISDRFVSPATGSAYVLVEGKLRKLPEGLALGVPVRFWPLVTSGIVSPFAALKAGLDFVKGDDWPGGDESVGGLIRRRLGDQVAERLVDPLVGSIYAGNTDDLDLHLVTPQFETAARQHRSLISGLRSQRKQAPPSNEPVFYGFPDGKSHLVEVLT
ncbi:MAG: protoporphyrinogen oxidase, partial [Actinomycetota bacterium]|nr:protoporphyrinogen oxidase [Actinomycetota bacterium]